MSFTRYSWILAVCVILSCSCSKPEEGNREEAEPAIVPFKTGNKWTYEFKTHGVQAKSFSYSTTEIGEYVEVNGNKGYRVEGSCASFLVRNDEKGNVIEVGGYSDRISLFVSTNIKYKKNAVKGEKWQFNIITEDCSHSSIPGRKDGLFVGRSALMTCLHADTLIETAKGGFRCKAFSYSPDGGENTYIDFVSDGVGRIRTAHYEGKCLISYSDLVDYTLK